MTPTEIEAMTPAELALELDWDPRILTTLTHRKHLVVTVRDAVAESMRRFPDDVIEHTEGMAAVIAMRWPPTTENARIAERLALILLRAYTPEEP